MQDTIRDAILDLLVQQGILTLEQVADVKTKIAAGQGDLSSLLVGGRLADEEAVTRAHAQALGMEYLDLREVSIPQAVLNIIPESTAREHRIIAYEQTAEALKVAMADPSDRQIVEFIHKKVDMLVHVSLASEGAIRTKLADYQLSLTDELRDIATTSEKIVASSDLNKAAEDLPIIRITDVIFKHAILEGASDIHLEPTEDAVVIRYRIDGLLRDVVRLPKKVLPGLVARIKVLSNLKIDEHRLPQDGRFLIETDDYKYALRVSIFPVYDGEKTVMRLLDESGRGFRLDDVGMRPAVLAKFRDNISKPHGMVLVTGPTGSGKTTTLYAALQELNTPQVNISTIEDPIEYRVPRVNQTQVQERIGLTFATGLRSLVRQDPDIIMVGEIRDDETASLAVNAALTGHLVLSTLHTNSAAGALPRLLDLHVEAFLIASTINLLVAQRLVRRLCEYCRKQVAISETLLADMKQAVDAERLLTLLRTEKVIADGATWKDMQVYEAEGCKRCTDGYKGRIGIFEILELTPEIQALISLQTTDLQLQNAAREQQNMVAMIEDGFMKVMQGLTTAEEVLRAAKE